MLSRIISTLLLLSAFCHIATAETPKRYKEGKFPRKYVEPYALEVTPINAPATKLSARWRQPTAIVLSEDGKQAYVAQRRTGSLSILELAKRQTVAEFPLAQQLADLQSLGDGRLVAIDDKSHELLVLDVSNNTPRVTHRVKVSPFPVQLAVSPDRNWVTITSLWSQQVSRWDVRTKPRKAWTTDLTFAPFNQQLVQHAKTLIVADAQRGRLAILNAQTGKLNYQQDLPGHGIRGLAVANDNLLVAHQKLNALAPTIRNDVHWGVVMSNDLRWISIDRLTTGNTEFFTKSRMQALGEPKAGAGDPDTIALAADGTVLVSLAGANSLAIGRESSASFYQLPVGQRPGDIAIARDQPIAYVVNRSDDTVSVVDFEERQELARISIGPQGELSNAEKGDILFHNATLSHDRWMSCHSCHPEGHTNGMLADNFSDGSYGAPKRVPSLLGVRDTPPYAWLAVVTDLSAQVKLSTTATMQGSDPSDAQVASLRAYMETLRPPPSIDVMRDSVDLEAIARGKEVFIDRRCDRCHKAPTYTTPKAYDVGLVDSQGNKKFNPPSLRGVGQRSPYFHDSSAATLHEVFSKQTHRLTTPLPEEDLQDLLAFLRSL